MVAVSILNLVKSFGSLVAVNDVTLEVREGETYGLLGPNGAGKTTTIKCLMGLLDPDTGTTSVYGVDSLDNPIEGVQSVPGLPVCCR